MFKRTKINIGALLAIGLVTALPTMAQDAQRVEVTGTRITSPGATSSSPITSVTAAEIQSSQPVAVEEFVKNLSVALPGIGNATNNGSGGGATIDLRGLGANRSLVLINGRRMVPFDLNGAVDTNSIPLALLQRVDLVTGGASAVYGADAVAGVANFVLKKDFRGFSVDTSYGTSERGDAGKHRIDFTMGAGLENGRGNVALSFGFTKTNPLRQDKRPIGAFAISSKTGAKQGSGTTVPVQISGQDLGGNVDSGQINTVTGNIDPDVQTYNFNPDNYYQTPLKRTQVTALGNYVISDKAEIYTELLFSRSEVNTQLAPSGSFLNDYFVPLGNPYLPAAAKAQICAGEGLTAAQCADANQEVLLTLGRRFVELGPRLNDFKNSTYQVTLGMKGDLMAGWSYDVYGSRGKAEQGQTRGNWGSLSKLQQALRATSTTACNDTSNGCVPINVFGAAGSITPAMLKFINLDAVLGQTVDQTVFSGAVNGDLGSFKSPMAKSPISIALGAEYREVTAANKSDSATQVQGEVLGSGAPTPDRSGTIKLKEGFIEAQVPLAADLPGVYRASLDLGYRQSEFTALTSTNYGTYKYGGEWAPIKGLKFRAMKQRATRAPNINELFAPTYTGLSNQATDPCGKAAINAAQANTAGTLSNLCRLTGVPIGQIGQLAQPSAGQINVLNVVDPNNKPEVADTTTLGLVWAPDVAKGLTVTADYFKIVINSALTNPSATDILGDCYSAATNPGFVFNSACALVGRNPNNGSFNGVASKGVTQLLSNQGKIETSGYDLGVSYRLSLADVGLNASMGRVDFALNATLLDDYNYQATPVSVNRKCVGYYSVACGTVSAGAGPISRVKWSQRTNWSIGDFTVGYNWRHLSAVTEEPGGDKFLEAFSTIKAYDYVDLAASWNVNKTLRIGLAVNNAFDKAPPAVGNTIGTTGANSGNTFPQTYDVIGRAYSLSANLKF